MRNVWTLAACLAFALAAAPAVRADRGVGIDLGRIDIDQRLSPGGVYRLPTLTVSNTGDEPGDYRVRVTDPGEPGLRPPPADWFDIDPSRFRLGPGQSAAVAVKLTLPTGADPGRYGAYLEAGAVADGDGVGVAAAAAALVTFEVKPSSLLAAWLLKVSRFVDDSSPWSIVAAAGVLIAGAAALLRRHVRFSVTIRRRRD